MVLQLIPVKAHISICSQKVVTSLFRPIKEEINYKDLEQYNKDRTESAYKVMGEISAAYNLGVLYEKKARRVHNKGNFSVEEFTLNQAIKCLKDGLKISKPLYNSSYMDFLKYRYEIHL